MDNENISPEEEEELGSSACYELNELDLAWLDFVNKTRKYRGTIRNFLYQCIHVHVVVQCW